MNWGIVTVFPLNAAEQGDRMEKQKEEEIQNFQPAPGAWGVSI